MVVILSDAQVASYLDTHLSQQLLLTQFVPHLVRLLQVYGSDPDVIVPPRTVIPSNNPNSDTTHLYMPCIAPEEVGIKIISGGPGNNQKGLGFAGCVLVLDEITGETKALINGATLTAFRTALASMIGVTKVVPVDSSVDSIAVFGVGRQAEWHIKLALLLYPQITKVSVFNRTKANADKLVAGLQTRAVEYTTGSFEDAKSAPLAARIVFGCCPSTEPVILALALTAPVMIALIGSYKPHMIELEVPVVELVLASGIPIIVDSKEHCLHEAGELIQANVNPEQLVELAHLEDDVIAKLREAPIVVQKLVGLSVMDISIGKFIIDNNPGGVEVDF